MRKLYNVIEGILSTDTEIKAKGEYEVFIADIAHELKLNFDIDRSAFPRSTGDSKLPFAAIRNFDGYQYKKALDNFNDHLGAVKSELKRKGIKTEVTIDSSDQILGRSVTAIKEYKLIFSKSHSRNTILTLNITLMFGGEYKQNDTILKLVNINISSPNVEIKEIFK